MQQTTYYYSNPQHISQQPYQQNIVHQPTFTFNTAQQKLLHLKQHFKQTKQKIIHPINSYDQYRYRKKIQEQRRLIQEYKLPENKVKIHFQPERQQPRYLGRQKQLEKHAKGIQKAEQLKLQHNQMLLTKTNVINPKQNQNSYENQKIYERIPKFYPQIRYKIIPSQSPKMSLDVTSINDQNDQLIKGNLIIWEFHGGPNQLFYLEEVNGWYHIISCSTGYILEVANASREDQAMLIMSPRVNSQSEKFRIESYGVNLFRIRTFCNKFLDLKSDWIRNGQSIIQYQENKKNNQAWRIVPS